MRKNSDPIPGRNVRQKMRKIYVTDLQAGVIRFINEFGKVVFFSLLAYLVFMGPAYLWTGATDREAHNLGLIAAVFTFGVAMFHYGEKNGWVEKFENFTAKLDGEDTSRDVQTRTRNGR